MTKQRDIARGLDLLVIATVTIDGDLGHDSSLNREAPTLTMSFNLLETRLRGTSRSRLRSASARVRAGDRGPAVVLEKFDRKLTHFGPNAMAPRAGGGPGPYRKGGVRDAAARTMTR